MTLNISAGIRAFAALALVAALVLGSGLSSARAQTSSPAGASTTHVDYLNADGTLARQLALGMSGDDVAVLQSFLAQYPSIYPQALVTGYFGPLTQAAVERYQQANNLPPVGTVGPETLALINTQLLSYRTSPASSPATNTNSATSGNTGVGTTTSPMIPATAPVATTTPSMTSPSVPSTIPGAVIPATPSVAPTTTPPLSPYQSGTSSTPSSNIGTTSSMP